ncbi:AI-2E family transporter [Saccharibacillus alkalitolerans]|uniref:AI-2E family transporter n=1 Tax=Saccharibacillus alkalitolerans TaxID=2705290 RepID=A0ABX0F3F9_9BACL|nr:AI-2E family transporter [Saccharibacillus alkalitolerans]NGZ73721.1 AI-2E family transporter [Saccharibacillus alkalitolerans]
MISLYRKYWRTAFDIALIILTVYLVMLAFSWLYGIAAPIFLSLVVYLVIEPFARFLNRRKVPKPLAAAISVLVFVLIILGALFGAGLIFVSQIARLTDNLPEYTAIVQHHFANLTEFLHNELNALPAGTVEKANEYFAMFTDQLTVWLKYAFAHVLAFLTSFSSFIVSFTLSIILAFFLSSEIVWWKKIAGEKTPNTLKTAFAFLKNHVFRSIGSYLKAQAILVFITFVIVYAGLLILRVDNAFAISIVSALFDILPLLGVPAIFIPWVVYLFIVGNTGLAIGLIVLLAVVMLTRQLLEPKIAGNSIGISSAYLMLSFVLISTSLFGMAGLVLAPILLILIKELLQQGYLQRWIRMPQEEFAVHPLSPSGPQPAASADPAGSPAPSSAVPPSDPNLPD